MDQKWFRDRMEYAESTNAAACGLHKGHTVFGDLGILNILKIINDRGVENCEEIGRDL